MVNGHLHTRCPKYLAVNEAALRFVVDVYFDCKDSKTWPYPGGMMAQTAFTVQVFQFLDVLVAEYISKEQERSRRENDKIRKELESRRKK